MSIILRAPRDLPCIYSYAVPVSIILRAARDLLFIYIYIYVCMFQCSACEPYPACCAWPAIYTYIHMQCLWALSCVLHMTCYSYICLNSLCSACEHHPACSTRPAICIYSICSACEHHPACCAWPAIYTYIIIFFMQCLWASSCVLRVTCYFLYIFICSACEDHPACCSWLAIYICLYFICSACEHHPACCAWPAIKYKHI